MNTASRVLKLEHLIEIYNVGVFHCTIAIVTLAVTILDSHFRIVGKRDSLTAPANTALTTFRASIILRNL
jgi:hypothetical protein